MSSEASTLHLAPGRVALWLGVTAGLLQVANVAAEWLQRTAGWRKSSLLYQFAGKFLVIGEHNIPAYFSALLLLACAALLAIIGVLRRRAGAAYAWHWLGLALIFVYLSLDEEMALHEMAMRPVAAALDLSGILRLAWVVPAMILLVVFAVVYWRFVLHLPARVRALIVLAGLTYVGGSLGFEVLSGKMADMFGDGFLFHAVSSAEEALEMAGLILFIYALLDYICAHLGSRIVLDFETPTRADERG